MIEWREGRIGNEGEKVWWVRHEYQHTIHFRHGLYFLYVYEKGADTPTVQPIPFQTLEAAKAALLLMI
jgi:hypothetical protein